MRLGISSWAYGWAVGISGYPRSTHPLTSLDLLLQADLLGVDLVQIADNLPVHQLSSASLNSLRDCSRKLGISIELGTRGVTPEHLLHYLDLAIYLDSRLIRTLPVGTNSLKKAERPEESIASVIDRFHAAGVTLAVENYEQQTSIELAALIKLVGDPYLRACIDTVNSLGALEPPREVLQNLIPYAANLHFKDFTIRRATHNMGYQIEGAPAGEGMLDAEWLLAEFRRHEVNPTIILEQWTPWYGDIEKTIAIEKEWASRSIRYLSRYR